MIPRISFFFFLLLCFSCEIEDDFGKRDVSEDKGTFLLREDYGVNKIIWYSPTNVLIHQNGSALKIVNVNTKNTSIVSSNQMFYAVFGVTSDEKALVATYNENFGTYSLIAVDLSTETPIVLTEELSFGGYPSLMPLVQGTKVVYSEYSTESLNSVFLHDVVTNERKLILEHATPLAISPDGKKIAGLDQNNQGFVYDIEAASIVPMNLASDPGARIFWNGDGIVGFQILYASTAITVNVSNFSNPEKSFAVDGVQSEFLIISGDGEEFVYPTAKCSNPNFVYYCYGADAFITLKGVHVSTKKETEVAVFSTNPNEFGQVYFQSGDISPDGSQLVYMVNNELYLQDIPN